MFDKKNILINTLLASYISRMGFKHYLLISSPLQPTLAHFNLTCLKCLARCLVLGKCFHGHLIRSWIILRGSSILKGFSLGISSFFWEGLILVFLDSYLGVSATLRGFRIILFSISSRISLCRSSLSWWSAIGPIFLKAVPTESTF